jgi:hypothetical protein
MRRVKTSKHLLSGMNIKKASILSDFILAYDKAVRFYICYLWNNKVIHRSEIKNSILEIKLLKMAREQDQ